MEPWDVLILGSGPAGGTAAIYAARAGLKTALVSGPMPGGQLTTTGVIENFPGFPNGIQGPQFAQAVEEQARRFGAEFLFDIVSRVDLARPPFGLFSEEKEYRARALIVSTGSSPRRLGLPAERELAGRGLSYCATCDGRFFQGKQVAVVGGGDSAAEEALYLARLAARVYLVHRRDRLRAGPVLEQRVLENPKIEPRWNCVVEDLKCGAAGLEQAVLRDTRGGERREIDVQGVFVAIGHVPNSALFKDWLDLDAAGYIVTDGRTRTKIPGVFAAGDVADPHYRQAITAAGSGCMAAMEAARYLEAQAG
jgi:thioredoxin reductase (NADPH)